MYRVVIIDDDPIIRKGLSQTIKWENYGFSICGQAGDGLSGVDLIKETKPDLIITDIQMPGLTGFEMLAEIKNVNPDCEILIITAYRNFEYAKEALQHGARDLLLKPTKIEEIIKTIISVSEDLKKKDKIRDENEKQRELFKKNLPILRNKLIHDLIFGLEIWGDSSEERLSFLGIEWKEFYMLTARFQLFKDVKLSAYEQYLRLFGMSTILEQSFAPHFPCINIGIRSGQLSLLIGLNEGAENSITKIREICEESIITIKENYELSLTLSLSARHDGFQELRSAYQEANVAAEQAFFVGSDILIEYTGEKNVPEAEYTVDSFDELLYIIRGGNTEQVKKWNLSLMNQQDEEISIDAVKGKYWDLLSRIISIEKSLESEEPGISSKSSLELFAKIYHSRSIKELDKIILDYAVRVSEQVLRNQQQGISRIVDKAVAYIGEHYSQPLTLTDVSENVYVSTSYLSRIFKRVTNMNFSEYVNKVRIDEAKKLLKESHLMTYQIGEMVGYSDPHYFSRIFKKITGHSPTYFREDEE